MKKFILILMLFTQSCAYFSDSTGFRDLASFASTPVISENLMETTDSIQAFLSADQLAFDQCETTFANSFEFLSGLPSDYFDTDYSDEEYGVIIERLWNIKQLVRNHHQAWSSSHQMNEGCVRTIKNVMRSIRYLEDFTSLLYLDRKKIGVSGFDKTNKAPMFSQGFPWTMSQSGQFDSKSDLQSGDVLMWRSTTSVSAAIARIGDAQNNFSHLSIIYIDPNSGKRYNIESLIETGLIVEEFDEAKLHPGVSKLVVYRHKDPAVAARAGKAAFDLAKKTMGSKNHLFYDYNFNLNAHQEVFCSEVVHIAFSNATKGSLKLPAFQTQFNMRNRNFLRALGADIEQGFQPGDIDLEKDFTLIAEWRNLNHVRVNHLMDAILMSMYHWMDEYDYNFKWTIRGNLLGNALFFIRQTPGIGNALKARLAKNMPREALKTVIKLDQVSMALYEKLQPKIAGASFKQISHHDLMQLVEAYRLEDLARYQKQVDANRKGEAYPNPHFHHRFGPKLK